MRWIRRWLTADTTVPCAAELACQCSTSCAEHASDPCLLESAAGYSRRGGRAYCDRPSIATSWRPRSRGGEISNPFGEDELAAYEWTKMPAHIGRHAELLALPAHSRWLFIAILSEIFGSEPAGQFTYAQAMLLNPSRRGTQEALDPLIKTGFIATEQTQRTGSSEVNAFRRDTATTERRPSDNRAITERNRSTYVVLNYSYWSCGGPGVPAAQTAKDHQRKNEARRSPSRARAQEEKRREETLTDRTPSGSVRSVSEPSAAPRDARSAARRSAGDVVASGDPPAPPPEPTVNNGIANGDSESDGKTWTKAGDEAIAAIRAVLNGKGVRSAYLGNPEWKDIAERRERFEQAAAIQAGYIHTGKKPPRPDVEGGDE